MLQLYKLHHFVTLARSLNYAKAADELLLSQSALSRSIQSLERSLGIRLFDRSRSGVALTAAGRDMLHHASDLISRSAAVEESARAIARGRGGRVAFGMGSLASALILPKMIQLMAGELDGVSLDIRTETPGVLAELLLAGDIDFFLARFPASGVEPSIEVERLNKTVPNAAVRTDHPLAAHSMIDVDQLRLHLRAGAHGFKEILGHIPDPHRRAAYMPHIEFDGFNALYEFAAHSDLVVFGAFDHLGPSFATLRIPDEDAQFMVSDVALFRHEGRTLSPATLRVQELVRRDYALLE